MRQRTRLAWATLVAAAVVAPMSQAQLNQRERATDAGGGEQGKNKSPTRKPVGECPGPRCLDLAPTPATAPTPAPGPKQRVVPKEPKDRARESLKMGESIGTHKDATRSLGAPSKIDVPPSPGPSPAPGPGPGQLR